MKRFLILCLLVLIIPVSLFATYYEQGDQVFSFRGGVNFPGFIFFPNDTSRSQTFFNTHLKLGGYASLSYQGFTSRETALGGEIAYSFNYAQDMNLFTIVPLTMKFSYYPIQSGKFDLILSANVGGAFLRYHENKFFSPYTSFTIQPTFFITESWGIGLETGFMGVCEFYGKNSTYNKVLKNAFVGMLPLIITVSYRH